MKTWLKTGLISAGIAAILWIIFLVITGFTCEGEGCMVFAGGIFVGPIVIIFVFIIASIIGVIANKVANSEGTNFSKAIKMGIWVGLIGAVLYALIKEFMMTGYFSRIGDLFNYWNFGDLFFMGLIFIGGLIAGAVVYSLVRK